MLTEEQIQKLYKEALDQHLTLMRCYVDMTSTVERERYERLSSRSHERIATLEEILEGKVNAE